MAGYLQLLVPSLVGYTFQGLRGLLLPMGDEAEQVAGWNNAVAAMGEEPASFEELFNRERDRLFRVMYVVTGSRQEAEDLCQDAFARVWERWDSVGEMANPTGYLYRTAMNVFRNGYRRALLAAARVVRPSVPEDPFASVDDRHLALQALHSLAPRQRAAILMTEVLGYTAEEAGHILGIRAGTVRALHFQARTALRTYGETADA